MNKSKISVFIAFLFLQTGEIHSATKEILERYKEQKKQFFEDPCSFDQTHYLEKFLSIFSKDPKDAIYLKEVAQILLSCDASDSDYYFYLGRAEFLLGNDQKAIAALKKCLEIFPDYDDANFVLGSIYMKRKQYKQALDVFSKYPDDVAAIEKIGDIYIQQKEYKKAIKQFELLIKIDPDHPNYIRKYAYILSEEQKYHQAKEVLSAQLKKNPSPILDKQLAEIDYFVDPRIGYKGSYLESKENDPSLNQPVVRDYYIDQSLFFRTPVTDHFVIESKIIDFHQKERDIYPPIGVNYDVQLYGLQEKLQYNFTPNTRMDLILRGFKAYSLETGFYPFYNTWRFEPGLSISNVGERQFFFIDAHIESFIIKNFTTVRSELLRTDYFDIGYGMHLPLKKIVPEVEWYITEIFYHSSPKNRQDIQSVLFNLKIPASRSWIKGTYRFDHSSFEKLNLNYYSYKNQWISTLGGKAHAYLNDQFSFDLTYEHGWQVTKDLFQPIGDFVFIAPRQSLLSNKVSGEALITLGKRVLLNLYGHFFRDNQPYKEYQVKGGIEYQF
jgi:tetratricopeptide (TPR) repeat protein